jgi:hypothetical protein
MHEHFWWNNCFIQLLNSELNLRGINNLRQAEKLAAEPSLPKSVSIDILAPFDIGSLIYIKGRPLKTR